MKWKISNAACTKNIYIFKIFSHVAMLQKETKKKRVGKKLVVCTIRYVTPPWNEKKGVILNEYLKIFGGVYFYKYFWDSEFW